MLLVDADKSLEVLLSTGAPATVQPDWAVTWGKNVVNGVVGELLWNTLLGTTNSGTGVTMISAPDPLVANYFQVLEISVHNTDSGSVDVQIRINDNSTFYVLKTQTLAVGETLHYSMEHGWSVL
jgi:hypothetical protein